MDKLKISNMTGKLSDIQAINTNTLTNDFCSKMRESDSVCKVCYSASMLQGHRKNCADVWQRNSDTLSRAIPIENLPVINAHSFRFHGHGELINYQHLVNFMNIAIKNPFTTFALWTKRKNFISKWIKDNGKRDNVIFIYSNPKTDKKITKIPDGFDKVFNSVYDDTISDGETLCTGIRCMDCMACYRHNDKNIIVEKVK